MTVTKHKIRPAWFLVIAIAVLIIPTGIYLGFLIPQLKDEYIILLSSGGVIGGGGMFGTAMIPERTKYGALYKTATKSFTLLVVITLVREFIKELIGLAAVFIVSYILFFIFKELWKHGKRAQENSDLATEVARSIAETTK